MVSVEEASRIIFSDAPALNTEMISVNSSVGRILAETVAADRPFPPFDRVAMDGIAISFKSYEKGIRTFPIEGVQAAGEPQKSLGNSSNCLEAMTGAMLPNGTDTVIRYEDVTITDRTASIKEVVNKGQNVHRKGIDAGQDEVLLNSGIRLSSAEVALLASVGKSYVRVFAFPNTAIISTGDELVDINSTPAAHQIRRSNVYAIEAAMTEMSWPSTLFHLADDKNELLLKLGEILKAHDVIILSGGVSKGKFDHIPEVMQTLGVKKLFHQVNQRPGKPFWFGKTDSGKTVFALPGNPVSTFMCFYRYIKPWMLKRAGIAIAFEEAILGADFGFKPSMEYFLQVRITNESGKLVALPAVGGGSGDFANLKDVNGFLQLPSQKSEFRKGEVFFYIPFRT
jgi:molybdopterin molybdotransferase